MAQMDFEIEDGIEILDMDEQGDDEAPASTGTVSPDEFFAKHAFRVVYQTNNFLLPQLRDLVSKGEVLNLRPEYQRRLRWSLNSTHKCNAHPCMHFVRRLPAQALARA